MKPLLIIVILMEAIYLGHCIPTQPKTRTVTFHVEYNAYEDMFECPGTKDKVVDYKPLPNGAADVVCRIK